MHRKLVEREKACEASSRHGWAPDPAKRDLRARAAQSLHEAATQLIARSLSGNEKNPHLHPSFTATATRSGISGIA